MTGGINLSPEAERQLNELDDWITKRASADIAQRFVSAILDHNRDHSRVPVCRPSA
jgi:toxin ParE1/3/4